MIPATIYLSLTKVWDRTKGGLDALLSRFVGQALPAVLALVILDLLYFYASYARAYLSTPWHHVLFGLQGIALAAVLALLVAAVLAIGMWVVRVAQKVPVLRRPWMGVVCLAVFLAITGLALASNGGGRIFRLAPFWHYGVVLVPVAVLLGLAWFLVRRVEPVWLNVLALSALILSLWFLAHYLPFFFVGDFGLDRAKGRLRTIVTLGFLTVTACGAVLVAAVEKVPPGWASRGLQAGLLCVMALAHHLNATYQVDLNIEIHTWLMIVSLSAACLLAESVRVSSNWSISALMEGTPRKTRIALGSGLLIAGSAVTLGVLGIRSHMGYVGAVHTVAQRVTLELIYDDLPGLVYLIPRKYAYVRNRWYRLRRRKLPVDREKKLPSTFRTIARDPTLNRPPVKGAVLFMLDMKRPRDIGLYGRGSAGTPHIDRWFNDAFVFENCFSAASSTEVAFPTIYTSTYAATRNHRRHGMSVRPYWFAYQKGNNLGATFKRAGFRTAVVTNKWYELGFFRHPLKKHIFGGFERLVPEKRRVKDSVSALEGAYVRAKNVIPESGRYLTVFHLIEQAPGRLRRVDAFVGRVISDIKKNGRLDDTVLLLTSDHGVQYREHGRTTYGQTVFNEEVRVPLLILVPRLKGRKVSDYVSSVDHLPTLIDLFGIKADYKVEGRSYLPALFGKRLSDSRPIFAETRKYHQSVAIIRDHMKLIQWVRTGALALFDLDRDPGETRNLIEESRYRSVFTSMFRQLKRFLKERGEETWP